MTNRMAVHTVQYFEKRCAINADECEICIYAIETMVHTVLSIIGLLIIGALFNRFYETVIIMGVFCINQTCGGGIHANSRIKCFITMVIMLTICLTTYFIGSDTIVDMILSFVSIGILLYLPLVLHPNKHYLECKAELLKKRSRLITTIELLLLIFIMSTLKHYQGHAFCLGLFSSATSRTVAYLRHNHE